MGLAKLSRNIYFKPIPRGLTKMCSARWGDILQDPSRMLLSDLAARTLSLVLVCGGASFNKGLP
ncbi:MAG: hypothetical protein UT53_C0039G0002 [Candidatus Yanofskybacteria bacterium GW2011_GWD2_39_48]|uniref:Uncharacterized protein n=1 Tax=Candidatus Yanofskybacteria bacterium GW2011_GWD2_39_48 TaxID=1619031 RepID=A0A0G0RIX7_9BACT|nr:MAG: hypothetical protein UT53_C0039G0002 [Candidatus Yanofskybacteria bacterium GW2011_GWD2_39_48]